MLNVTANTRIFVYSQPTDMRKSFNGLSGLVASAFDVELLSGHLFLFINRRGDSMKILTWDRDGIAIWYKRLEKGTFQMPKAAGKEAIEIDPRELSLLLSGIDLRSAKRRPRYETAA